MQTKGLPFLLLDILYGQGTIKVGCCGTSITTEPSVFRRAYLDLYEVCQALTPHCLALKFMARYEQVWILTFLIRMHLLQELS